MPATVADGRLYDGVTSCLSGLTSVQDVTAAATSDSISRRKSKANLQYRKGEQHMGGCYPEVCANAFKLIHILEQQKGGNLSALGCVQGRQCSL